MRDVRCCDNHTDEKSTAAITKNITEMQDIRRMTILTCYPSVPPLQAIVGRKPSLPLFEIFLKAWENVVTGNFHYHRKETGRCRSCCEGYVNKFQLSQLMKWWFAFIVLGWILPISYANTLTSESFQKVVVRLSMGKPLILMWENRSKGGACEGSSAVQSRRSTP